MTGPNEAAVNGNGATTHVAFLLAQLTRGGAELQMVALARGLIEHGFRVDFVCRAGSGSLDEHVRSFGATVHVIGEISSAGTPMPVRYARAVGKQIRWVRRARRERYDIVDSWMHPSDYFGALSRPLTRIPVVAAARLDQLPRVRIGPATHLLTSAVNRLTDVVVANAELTAADAIREQGVPPHKVRIIRGGVELPRRFSSHERRAQRAALGATDDHLLIGCVGNFRAMKRQDLLIDAFARLLPKHRELRLILVGDGETRSRIERQVDRLGLSDHVVLFGSAADLPPIYDSFDLFVQASNSEALPNVLLEAAASALPIVATAAGGTGELISNGETGLLVPVDDLDRLASAMERAITDPDLRQRMGAAARDSVERDYGMDRFVREYVALYRDQLAAKGIPG
jgi:glycosyltransferase involved in cell wall biosynthesis